MKKITILAASAIGIAGGLGYLLTRNKGQKEAGDTEAASMRRQGQSAEDGRFDRFEVASQQESHENNHGAEVLDDRGTDQAEATEILRHVRDAAFEGSDEKFALALGLPTEEMES